MTLRTQRTAILFILAAFAYGGAYLVFRTLHIRRTETDGTLIFVIPEKQRLFSYVFAPLIYLDGAATGIQCQIAPPH